MDVVWHDEYFPPTTSDYVWLEEVGRRRWIVITHDARTVKRPSERQALINAQVGCFVLDGGSAKRWGKVMILGAAWRKIDAVMNNEAPPYVWQRKQSGAWVRRRLSLQAP